MFTLRLPRIEPIAVFLLLFASADASPRQAPNLSAAPVNQLRVSGNACGPAALIASFRCGNESWQRAETLLPGDDDKARITQWIRRYGLRPSGTLNGRTRWSNAGINVTDLTVAANEMTGPLLLPALVQDDLFLRPNEKPEALLRRVRERFDRSLGRGFPPVLSLRRFALRNGAWTPVQGHFVTVIEVPRKLPRGDGGFAFSYLDPWGGKRATGTLKLPDEAILSDRRGFASCLVAEVPGANIGLKDLRKGERSVVVPAALIGRW